MHDCSKWGEKSLENHLEIYNCLYLVFYIITLDTPVCKSLHYPSIQSSITVPYKKNL